MKKPSRSKYFVFGIIFILATLLIGFFCFKKADISGDYTMNIVDYSYPLFDSTNNQTLYIDKHINLCLDRSLHYIIFYGSCFIGDQGLLNYLSAGGYEFSDNKIILTDQWNGTKICLLKDGNNLLTLNGYRFLIGNYFVKDKDNQVNQEDSIACEGDWFFSMHKNEFIVYNENEIEDSTLKFQPGKYIGTSECGNELLSFFRDHTFIYKITQGIFYPYIILKGTWEQNGREIILTDPLIKNSFSIKVTNDTIYAGFNIPGSSSLRGKNRYFQAFTFLK